MTAPATRQFSVKNLDCAACAAKLERGLRQVEGVEDASLDFANLTLHVTARDMQAVLRTAGRLEPGVELTPKTQPAAFAAPEPPESSATHRREWWLLLGATAIFITQLLQENLFKADWPFPLQMALVAAAYIMAGRHVLLAAFKTIRNRTFFDENVLMVIATGGAIAIGAYSEAIGVMIFYKIGDLLQAKAVSRSRRSIHALLAQKPTRARVRTGEDFEIKAPETVPAGSIILVKPGEKIPLDGIVISGRTHLDSSALTGEFVPVGAGPGDAVMAGQINQSAAITVTVSKPFGESSIARLMQLVESATARKAATEKFITAFARYYTPGVVAAAAAIAFIPPAVTGWSHLPDWVYRALVLLVISCPCALVVSIPLGYFGGIGRASKNGILVKGSTYIDALSKVDTVVFDKTGTLTQGVFTVKKVVSADGFPENRLLAFAAAAEYHSAHPIARSIVSAHADTGDRLDSAAISEHEALHGLGVRARYQDHVILVGNDALLHSMDIDHQQCDFDDTVAHIVVDGVYAGHILIGDQIRRDAIEAVAALRKQGVAHLAMLTGDNACAARSVGVKLGLDALHADLLPEDKVALFEQIKAQHHGSGSIAFVGDGLNDAPVLARADVGVAMGGLGSDAAIETADVVLMADKPSKMAEAVAIARKTRRIVRQNIVLAFAIKGVFLTFGAMGMATMWEAVFADMGTALLAVANATRILRGN